MKNKKSTEVKFQPASIDIWLSKYALQSGGEKSPADSFRRVAKALAVKEGDKKLWEEKFTWAMENGAIPAGRILSNAGAEGEKPATSLINCTVAGKIPDSMEGILQGVKEAGLTLKAGCGIGYEFSTLRPKGAWVKGAGAETSGPLSFMDVFDSMCFTVSSAGGRRGAQMGTFDVSHPDVEAFIKAKREDGRLRHFNLSLLITDEFVRAVRFDQDWDLIFPLTSKDEIAGEDCKVVEKGGKKYKVYKTIKARYLWDLIMKSTYDFAEPGFILIDRVNRMNNLWFCENIRATNPCGEQPLPEYGACLLGSVNLTHFVTKPFTKEAGFDFAKFGEVVRVFTRMLDNVVEFNGLPLAQQREEIERKRRHGMGFTGLGSMLVMMGMEYGSEESLKLAEDVTKMMAVEGWREGVRLAKEKGAAPIFSEDFVVTEEMLARMPTKGKQYEVGDVVSAKELFLRSAYMQKIVKETPELADDILKYGVRFTHHTSIAPTGTISLSVGNNCSNGIEPSFGHHYVRNVIIPGKKTKQKVDVFSYELLLYRELVDPEAMPYTEKPLPKTFVDSGDISPKRHVDIQAVVQKWVDSSISKTINVATDCPFDEFKEIYLYAEEKGLKGCTTFRYNPENFQGVLVSTKDLESMTYTFETEDGEVITAKGNEEVYYDGEMHNAANLYDALKEGYYGKF